MQGMEERPASFLFFFFNRKKNQTFNPCSWGGIEATLGVLWHIWDKKGEEEVLDFQSEDEWLTGGWGRAEHTWQEILVRQLRNNGASRASSQQAPAEALLFTRLNLHWARATWPQSPPGVGFVSEPPEGSADCKAAYLVRSVSSHCTYQDHEKRNCDSNAHVCQVLKKKKKISRSIV